MAKFMALTEVGNPDRPVLVNLDNATRIFNSVAHDGLVTIFLLDQYRSVIVRETLAEIHEALRVWPSPTPAQIKVLEKIKETSK
jgi:hypothetical protein